MKYFLSLLILLTVSCKSHDVDDIILVNAGTADREGLANLITKINQYDPSVVAIDFQFSSEDPKVDDKLIMALSQSSNLVMVSIIDDYLPGRLFYDTFTLGCLPKFTRNAKNGFANLLLEEDSVTLRRFSQFEYVDGRREFSFAMQTAYQYDSARAKSFMGSHNNFIDLDFNKGITKFKRFSLVDFMSDRVNREQVEGRIVMIGFLGPGDEDRFVAWAPGPIKLEIYGLEFHAQVVCQILGL